MKLALFDLDGTLLPTDSDHAFGEFMCATGWVDGEAWRARNQRFFEQYQAGTLVLADYVAFATSAWRDRPPAEAEAARANLGSELLRAFDRDVPRREVAAGRQEQERDEVSEGV